MEFAGEIRYSLRKRKAAAAKIKIEIINRILRIWVDSPGIEPGPRQCECRVIPLYYEPHH
jgi:hypothetical protein